MTLSPTRRPTYRIVAGLIIALATSTSALAADAQAFGDRLKDIAAKGSVPFSFSGAESAGENVVLKGVKIGNSDEAANLGDVTFEGVAGSTAGGWTVQNIPISDVDTTEGTKKAVIKGMSIKGLQIAGTEGESKLPGQVQYFFDSAAVESLALSDAGKPLFSLAGSAVTNTVASGSGAIASDVDFGDFSFDFAAMPADKTTDTMRALGYPQLAGTGMLQMGWNPTSGEVTLSPFKLSVKDAGDLSLAYQINGYTPAFAKSLQQIQEQMAANPENSSAGMAVIGLLSQLSVASLKLDFVDASLTNKLLDYYAKENGQTREAMVSGITGMMPMALAALQNPEFQAEVTKAVETFLKDPKSLTIAMAPDQPIAATQIMGAAMGAPQTLPSVLQLKVTANGQ